MFYRTALSSATCWLITLSFFCFKASAHEPLALVIGHTMLPNSIALERAEKTIAHIQNETDIQLKLKYLPAKRSLMFANQGVIDGDIARPKSFQNHPQFNELEIVDISWTQFRLIVIKHQQSNFNIDDWDSLSDLNLCLFRGSVYVFDRVMNFELAAVHTSNPMQALKLVSGQRCDVAVLWREQLTQEDLAFMSAQNLVFDKELAKVDAHIYIHKKHKPLIKPIETAIASID